MSSSYRLSEQRETVRVFIAGAVNMIEPGPAAAGVVVLDAAGHTLAHRSRYLGISTQAAAEQQALALSAELLATKPATCPVTYCVESRALADTLSAAGVTVQIVRHVANPAAQVAQAPLSDWVPQRSRRGESLRVRNRGRGCYSVNSASVRGRTYLVELHPARRGSQATVSCGCADLKYREIPCQHVLAVARKTGREAQVLTAQVRVPVSVA